MEIISRSEAVRRGLSQYFTNIPCKNNHISYRYTSSGTCAACVRVGSGPLDQLLARQAERRERQIVTDNLLANLVQFRARVFYQDVAFYSAIVHAAALMREPACLLSDVWKNAKGTGHQSGTAMFPFFCFPEDLAELQASAKRLFSERNTPAVAASIDETRRRAFGILDQQAADAGAPPEEFEGIK